MKWMIVLLGLFSSFNLFSQCDFEEKVEGSTPICPNTSTVFSVADTFDNYQWYRRGFQDSIAEPIPGETLSTIEIQASQAPAYYSVILGWDSCFARTEEKLFDAYVFLLPTVVSTGDYTVGDEGEFVLCEGDSMKFQLNMPYDTLITWFQDGVEFARGEQEVSIKKEGIYSVEGAPTICPNFIQRLGVPLVVEVIKCQTSVEFRPSRTDHFYPNPSQGKFRFSGDLYKYSDWKLVDANGKLLPIHMERPMLDISHLDSGTYWVLCKNAEIDQEMSWKIIKK